MDNTDQRLLDLLENDARESTAALARKSNLSRSTVQDRINRLKNRGIISGFTVKYSNDFDQQLITAHVMISIDQLYATRAITSLKQIAAMKSLYAISGIYDMIAILKARSTGEIDDSIDRICEIEGINKTTSSIVLSSKFER